MRRVFLFILQAACLLILVSAFGAAARAQIPADVAIMEDLRDNHGLGQAFGWSTTTVPCPSSGNPWVGVVCSDDRVLILSFGCSNSTFLTTPFPGTEIAGLTGLVIIEARLCYPMPQPASNFAALDTMPQLTKLRLDANSGISGTLNDIFPQGLSPTRFPVLTYLGLNQTSLGGQIPASIMAFDSNRVFRLNHANFSGTLPATGNPSKRIFLQGNALEGVLPDYIRNATGSVYLRYNKFDVVNTPPGNIDTLDPLWRSTQTVPPTNVQVTPTGAGTAALTWTPIAYQEHGGYYEVLSSQTAGGPYVSRGTTANSGAKTASSLTVSGLPGGTNYFVVRTFTPAHIGEYPPSPPADPACSSESTSCISKNNPNDLTSVNSAETSAVIVGPTAASVSIGGRVFAGKSRGLSNALVYLTDSHGSIRIARTNSFGYYRFADIAAGQTVIISVVSKRLLFAPQIVSVSEENSVLNFYGEP